MVMVVVVVVLIPPVVSIRYGRLSSTRGDVVPYTPPICPSKNRPGVHLSSPPPPKKKAKSQVTNEYWVGGWVRKKKA